MKGEKLADHEEDQLRGLINCLGPGTGTAASKFVETSVMRSGPKWTVATVGIKDDGKRWTISFTYDSDEQVATFQFGIIRIEATAASGVLDVAESQEKGELLLRFMGRANSTSHQGYFISQGCHLHCRDAN